MTMSRSAHRPRLSRRSRVLTILVATLSFVAAGSVEAALKPLEQAYELTLGAVTLPGNEVGQLVVRRCAACKPDLLRVNGATRYFIRPATAPVTLRDARTAATKAGATAGALVYVYYQPASRNVTRIVLDLGSVAPAPRKKIR